MLALQGHLVRGAERVRLRPEKKAGDPPRPLFLSVENPDRGFFFFFFFFGPKLAALRLATQIRRIGRRAH